MQSFCHPEQAFFAQREHGLSEAEGSRSLRRNNRAFGSPPHYFAGPFCSSGGAAGLANFASSTGTFSFTSLI